MGKRVTKLEPAPPLAALDLFEDQVKSGHRKPHRPRQDLPHNRFETAATWERTALNAPIERLASCARIARASLTGKSPRTRRGRWRRDLAYLEDVEAEALATLPVKDHKKYRQMVAEWRDREPPGFFGRFLRLRNRLRRAEQ